MACECGGLHLHRRALLGSALALGAGAVVAPWHRGWAADGAKTTLTPDAALALLKEGNAKFVADNPAGTGTDSPRRVELAAGQAPFAALLCCSDSRVPPELVFDRGLGELFVVRVAGNTVDQVALGSLEYAVSQLGAPLIVVLGHEACGAVSAAISVAENQASLPGSLDAVVAPILPAVLTAKKQSGDLLHNAIVANVERTVARLQRSDALLTGPIADGKLKVVGATYDLASGKVAFLA
jgi:carbonic anhydrase